MGGGNVDQRDRGFIPFAEFIAQLGGELQPSGAAAYDDDVVWIGCHYRLRDLDRG